MSVSGAYLSARIGNTTIAGVQSWTASESVDELDAQVGSDNGYSKYDFGSITLSVTLDLVQDISSGVYTTIRAGTTITNLNLYRNANATSQAFNVPTFKVYESEQKGAIKDRFTTRVSGKAYGNYTAYDPS